MNKHISLFSFVIFASIYMASNAHATLSATDHFSENGVISVSNDNVSTPAASPAAYSELKNEVTSSQNFSVNGPVHSVKSTPKPLTWVLFVTVIGVCLYGAKKGYDRFKEMSADLEKPRLIIYK